MPLEIERKFLVTSDNYKIGAKPVEITQAYLTIQDNLAIRVRIEEHHASLAIKSKISERVNREYEYNIPLDEARSLMKLSKDAPQLEQIRLQWQHQWRFRHSLKYLSQFVMPAHGTKPPFRLCQRHRDYVQLIG